MLFNYPILFALFYLARMSVIEEMGEDVEVKSNYECLNGKNPDNMSRKDMLKEFAKGPCSPLIILPALLSTRLIVEIDCETLRGKNPGLFKLCGWNSCKKDFYEFWKYVPLPEYQLWIPSITGPLSIFQFKEKKNQCWANFVKLAIDTTKPFNDSVVQQQGFRVKVFGQTPRTEKYAECGDGANKNLLGYEWFEIKKTRYLYYLFKKLKGMGYVAGLTYQTLPFDFRLSYRGNQINKLFLPNLKRINKLTGKKIVLLGHSLGNVNIYHQLINLDRDIKKKLIKSWIPVGSAVGGALQAFNAIVAGDDEFMYFKNTLGIHFHSEILAFNKLLSSYELLPIDFFTYHENKAWLKALEKRIQYEEGQISYEDSGFNFLPRLEEKCSPSNFVDYPTDCRMGLFDYRKKYIIKIKEDEYKVKEIEKMLAKYNMTESTLDIFKYTRDNQMIKLQNPEVPIISINLRTGLTVEQYDYDYDIREHLYRHDYPKGNTKVGYGDGVLSSTTQLAGPLKWAFEYDNNEKHAQPVKLIDFCSTYNVKYNVYDREDEKTGNDITKNEFIGINCDCMKQKSAENCNHPNIMVDSYVHMLIANVLKSNERSYTEIYSNYIDSLEEKELSKMTETCPQIRNDAQSTLGKKIQLGINMIEK